MKTMAKGIWAKVLGAGLLAGAVGLAVPAAQAQQYGYGTYDRYGSSYNGYSNGYYANSYDRHDRFRDRDDWKRRREWERHEAQERRRYEHEQRKRMERGEYGYGWR